jgi:hypothetical protein
MVAGRGVLDLATCAEGLCREPAVPPASLTLPWSTRRVEGEITRPEPSGRRGSGRCALNALKRGVRFLAACPAAA